MDPETREYFEAFAKSINTRFDSMEQRFEGRFQSMEQRFDSMEQRFESMEGRLDSMEQRSEGRFQSIERQLQEFREETAQNFDWVEGRLSTVETGLHHTQILVEDLRGQVQLVAEGVATCNERLDRLEEKVDRGFAEERANRTLHEGDLDRRLRVVEKPKE
jgi:predicted  nucleic acid-binding Zn-ribbon protein